MSTFCTYQSVITLKASNVSRTTYYVNCTTLFVLLLSTLKLQRDAIHAVAQAGRPGAVIEDVAEMAATAGADYFGAQHAELPVGVLFHAASFQGLVEAGQPVPESNLASELKSGLLQAAQRYRPCCLFLL